MSESTTSSSHTTTTASCDNCGKLQSDLPNPLKRCAKCHTGKYCSRDCQKAAFKTHKKICKLQSSSTPPSTSAIDSGESGSLINPPKAEIISGATRCIDLMMALRARPGLGFTPADDACPLILRNAVDFVQRSFMEYWSPLLPGRLSEELFVRASPYPEQSRRYMERQMSPEQAARWERWPEFNQEMYSDAISRNIMASLVVLDETRQGLFGRMGDEVYDFGDEVRAVARALRDDP